MSIGPDICLSDARPVNMRPMTANVSLVMRTFSRTASTTAPGSGRRLSTVGFGIGMPSLPCAADCPRAWHARTASRCPAAMVSVSSRLGLAPTSRMTSKKCLTRLAVHREDAVAGAQAGLLRGAAGEHAGDLRREGRGEPGIAEVVARHRLRGQRHLAARCRRAGT